MEGDDRLLDRAGPDLAVALVHGERRALPVVDPLAGVEERPGALGVELLLVALVEPLHPAGAEQDHVAGPDPDPLALALTRAWLAGTEELALLGEESGLPQDTVIDAALSTLSSVVTLPDFAEESSGHA